MSRRRAILIFLPTLSVLASLVAVLVAFTGGTSGSAVQGGRLGLIDDLCTSPTSTYTETGIKSRLDVGINNSYDTVFTSQYRKFNGCGNPYTLWCTTVRTGIGNLCTDRRPKASGYCTTWSGHYIDVNTYIEDYHRTDSLTIRCQTYY